MRSLFSMSSKSDQLSMDAEVSCPASTNVFISSLICTTNDQCIRKASTVSIGAQVTPRKSSGSQQYCNGARKDTSRSCGNPTAKGRKLRPLSPLQQKERGTSPPPAAAVRSYPNQTSRRSAPSVPADDSFQHAYCCSHMPTTDTMLYRGRTLVGAGHPVQPSD